mgnify:CR=1 FL=1
MKLASFRTNLVGCPTVPLPRPPTPHGHLFPRGNKWQVRSKNEEWRSEDDITTITLHRTFFYNATLDLLQIDPILKQNYPYTASSN